MAAASEGGRQIRQIKVEVIRLDGNQECAIHGGSGDDANQILTTDDRAFSNFLVHSVLLMAPIGAYIDRCAAMLKMKLQVEMNRRKYLSVRI